MVPKIVLNLALDWSSEHPAELRLGAGLRDSEVLQVVERAGQFAQTVAYCFHLKGKCHLTPQLRLDEPGLPGLVSEAVLSHGSSFCFLNKSGQIRHCREQPCRD